jgi:hypothetical protein
MQNMPYRYLTPHPAAAPSASDRLIARLMGWLTWALLACIGLVFALSLLVWLVVMAVVSLVVSVFTGRPAGVTLLWRRYRDLSSQFARPGWPRAGAASTTPRADAASATGAASPASGVQDVRWRDVPAAPRPAADTPSSQRAPLN